MRLTGQQPHTPTTEVIRETYIGEPPYTLYGYTEEEFDRWLATVEAAAEQRGAARAWDEGFEGAYRMAKGYGHVDHWMDSPENPYRADQMENAHG